jgi:hypothetical protein
MPAALSISLSQETSTFTPELANPDSHPGDFVLECNKT